MEIRRSYDSLISKMGFPILVRWHFHIESGSRHKIPWDASAINALFIYCLHQSPVLIFVSFKMLIGNLVGAHLTPNAERSIYMAMLTRGRERLPCAHHAWFVQRFKYLTNICDINIWRHQCENAIHAIMHQIYREKRRRLKRYLKHVFRLSPPLSICCDKLRSNWDVRDMFKEEREEVGE